MWWHEYHRSSHPFFKCQTKHSTCLLFSHSQYICTRSFHRNPCIEALREGLALAGLRRESCPTPQTLKVGCQQTVHLVANRDRCSQADLN